MVTSLNNLKKINDMIENKINCTTISTQTQNLTKSVGVQTGVDDDLCISLSHSKRIQLYFSKSYREKVLSFNLGNSKKFIITKKKWMYFRKFLKQIDETMTK